MVGCNDPECLFQLKWFCEVKCGNSLAGAVREQSLTDRSSTRPYLLTGPGRGELAREGSAPCPWQWGRSCPTSSVMAASQGTGHPHARTHEGSSIHCAYHCCRSLLSSAPSGRCLPHQIISSKSHGLRQKVLLDTWTLSLWAEWVLRKIRGPPSAPTMPLVFKQLINNF